MRLSVFSVLCLLVVAGCGRSVEDSCGVVCETNEICQPGGPGAASCNELCLELAADESYADALEIQADCYDEQAENYSEKTGVCLAIRGGACGVEP